MTNNYLRFLRDVKYDLLVPPLGIDYTNMTSKQAKDSFEWFISKIPERMNYFRNRCAQDLNIPVEKLGYTTESLVFVWKWFINTARMEKTPKEELEKMQEAAKIFGESFINREQFTVATKFIMRDIGMYLGECYVLNYPNLYWTYKTKPKSSVTVNQPLIAGFRASYMGKEGDIFFPPIHMVGVQAAKIYDQSQNVQDLYDIFVKWAKSIPPINS